jgi:carbonic anhydrase
MFIHRNIANLVCATDLNVMSVVNYAVRHLHVKHIIVCGHYGCGGVKAAMTPKDMGLLNPWLRNIRDVYRLHQDELDRRAGEEYYQDGGGAAAVQGEGLSDCAWLGVWVQRWEVEGPGD